MTRFLRAYLTSMQGGAVGDDEQMEADLRAAIAVSPEFAPPYGVLAMYVANQGTDLPEALKLAQKAQALEPGNTNYQIDLAQRAGAHGSLPGSAENCTACARQRRGSRGSERRPNGFWLISIRLRRDSERTILDDDSAEQGSAAVEQRSSALSSASGNELERKRQTLYERRLGARTPQTLQLCAKRPG